MEHPSLANIPEAKLVERLLADPYWRSNIVTLFGMPGDPVVLQMVSLNSAPGIRTEGPGDVDILLGSATRPDSATAIEVKRIKLRVNATRGGRPNKLRELKKAVEQANRLAKIGFSQVYLYVLVGVDTREQNRGKFSFEGASLELKRLIDREVSTSTCDLIKRIGLYKCEFVQPMDFDPLMIGSHHMHLIRSAGIVTQSDELTRWVAQKMAFSS